MDVLQVCHFRKPKFHIKFLKFTFYLKAFFVGVTVTTSSFCHFAALLAFFFTSNKATRFRQSDKKKIDYDFKPGGQRNAIQVLCNGLWPIIFSIAYMISLKRSGEITLDFSNNFEASFSTCAVLGNLLKNIFIFFIYLK